MIYFNEKIKQYGIWKCQKNDTHVKPKQTRKKGRGRLPGTAACNGENHVCGFVLDKPPTGNRTCEHPSEECSAPKIYTAIRWKKWRAKCGWCKRQWYPKST